MKKVLKITGICLIVFLILLATAFTLYYYGNMHWYDSYEKALASVGAEEKQVTLPNVNVINYGEVTNDKPAMLLIHGQMGEWEESFAYINTYKPLHEYNMSEKTECYEAYSLRHGYFGDKYGGIPDLAEKYHEKHPGEETIYR